jgi:hypothetical protein
MRSSFKEESVAERSDMHQKLMKQLADFLRRADLDEMPME